VAPTAITRVYSERDTLEVRCPCCAARPGQACVMAELGAAFPLAAGEPHPERVELYLRSRPHAWPGM
jgi:hypothetical protein